MTSIPELDPDTCPVCKSDRYLNPTMKLLVSPCFHKMCENCINRLFLQGPAPCPICKVTLRKSNFVAQTFEDLYVEKEVQIRKRVSRIYNKRLEDFKGNLRAYNDYLEEVEDILFNLINDVDITETNERIEKYQKENKELINANLHKQLIEERSLQSRLEREKKEKLMRKEVYEQAAVEEAKVKQQAKDDIIKRLASENGKSAQEIVEEARKQQLPDISKYLEAHLPSIHQSVAEGDPVQEQTEIQTMDHVYREETYTIVRDVYSDPWLNYLNDARQADKVKASGFAAPFTYQRSISAAFSGIFVGC